MKKAEYGKLWNLHTEKDWCTHFRDNMHTQKGPVCITSCVDCDEILDERYIVDHACAKIQERINKQLGIPSIGDICPTCRQGYIDRNLVWLNLRCTHCSDTWDDERSDRGNINCRLTISN